MDKQYDYKLLRGEIIKKYGTLGQFAKDVLKITPTYFSSILNNRTYFSQEQIATMIEVLHISNNEIGKYFFTQKVE